MNEELTRNVQAFAPYVTILMPILFLGVFAWLQTKFVTQVTFDAHKDATNKEIAQLRDRLADRKEDYRLLQERLNNHLSEYGAPPSRHDVSQSLAALSSAIASLKADHAATNRELGTLNKYLHTMIENGVRPNR